jgi:hypothetical protein
MTKSKNYPYSIFKYCDFSINSRTCKINSLENLKNNQIWLSNPLNFNDPFDCSVAFDANEINNEIAKKNINIIQNFLDDFTEDELPNGIKEIILKSSKPLDDLEKSFSLVFGGNLAKEINTMYEKMFIEGCNDFNTKYKSKLKVSCFSEINA